MPSHILMVAPATDKSRHGKCALATLSMEKSGHGRSPGKIMILLATRAPAPEERVRGGNVRLRVDFYRYRFRFFFFFFVQIKN